MLVKKPLAKKIISSSFTFKENSLNAVDGYLWVISLKQITSRLQIIILLKK